MKKGRMFYTIFITILVLGIGFVASFGSYIYFTTISSVVERVSNTKQSYMAQIRNSLEQKIQTIEYAFNTYSTTSSFNDVVKNPITEKDFIAYRNVNTQLNYIATMGLEGTEYSLISLDQNWRISNGSLSYLTKTEREKLIRTYIDHQEKGLFWIKTDNGIRFVNTLPVFSKKKQAIALSDISAQTLSRTIQTEDHMPVFILNNQGDLMYETQPAEQLLSTQQLLHISEATVKSSNTGMLTLEKTDQQPARQVIYAKSAYNNWTYLTVLDKKEIADAFQTTKFGIIMMGLVLTLLMVVVAYFIAVYFTKPFQQIKRSLPKNPDFAFKNEPSKNEIEWIINSIDNIVTEKESLESLIQSEMPQLETQLILNLFRKRISAEELARKMPRLGYPQIENQMYITLLVQLDNLGDREPSDKDVLLLAINKIVEETIPEQQRMLPIILNDNTQATILILTGLSEQEMRKQVLDDATLLVRNVKEYLNVSISIGISTAYDNLLESKEACEMSKQALHHRLNLGKESIIFYEDISMVISGPVLLHYPTELESKLFDAIRIGDEEQVYHTVHSLLEEMMIKNNHSMNFEVLLVRFVNNLIQLEQLLGIEVLLTQDNHALYHRLLDIRNPEEIERMLIEQVIFPMVKSMKEKTNQQFRCLSEKIAAIIRAEYDQELSLELIGDRLHYNPNYLSSIFKKEYGTTFSEYLMGYRLQMGKKWLVETDMTIKEIAERLQYHNSQNFIRSFRKKEQVTPGAYRKMKQAN
ncbi:AraC family transcriptional regulator [Paenibacillus polymyxa]|uniref:helix-turn-helix transcriptional regulator n=1 Tax=Paenibacillus polymyxa TaxID=1406 RepID=UPI0004D9BA3E|nr:helix-turn-helix transcriptional regulator [Paenibacillus polymyxa]KEO78334.1 AraC family transcriptional regulator [Paenibacillus polymyxa]MCH6187078.1 AraC family transcriptional regulator [Paenibacillus polymyxa]MDY8093031.1 helix-turn-helix transcriptional regulator [Paenibacillus polymyxa]WRL58867.1 helix-turn-helix transcriptional regulator [Paenibacillus polymyxa]